MAKCNYCKATIVLGGVREGAKRFCNNKCQRNGYLVELSQRIPTSVLQQQVKQIHAGKCPRCGGAGPVDVHRIYRVWSAVVLTSWVTVPRLSCRRCARVAQAGGIAFCASLGWWGFPFGLILTPIQITRNLMAICGGPKPNDASVDLENFVKVNLAANMTPPPLPSRDPLLPPVIGR